MLAIQRCADIDACIQRCARSFTSNLYEPCRPADAMPPEPPKRTASFVKREQAALCGNISHAFFRGAVPPITHAVPILVAMHMLTRC